MAWQSSESGNPDRGVSGNDDGGRDPGSHSPQRRPLMSRPAFVIPATFALAGVAGLVAEHLAPPNVADLVTVCAVWVALYPIPRLKPRIPWWNHWLQGVVILFAFWLMTRGQE